MNSYLCNPDGEENQQATKQTEREIFALKMQAKQDREYCETCGMLKSQCDCWDTVNGDRPLPVFRNCNVCGRELARVDELAIGMCVICANEIMPVSPNDPDQRPGSPDAGQT